MIFLYLYPTILNTLSDFFVLPDFFYSDKNTLWEMDLKDIIQFCLF